MRLEEDDLEMENGRVPVSAILESKEPKTVQPIENIPKSGANEEDVQVNIVGSGSVVFGGKAVEDVCEDATDYECSSSSSFGDTDSDTQDASTFTNNGIESLPMCDGDQSKTSLYRYVSDSVSSILLCSLTKTLTHLNTQKEGQKHISALLILGLRLIRISIACLTIYNINHSERTKRQLGIGRASFTLLGGALNG